MEALDYIVQERENRLYVSGLVNIAHDYIEQGELDLARAIIAEAQQYCNGAYAQYIKGVEFFLGIEETFATGILSPYLMD